MTDLNMDMFAFLTWLERNREAHTANGLTIKDGYGWYNRQWKCWLHNSDAGKQILSHNGEVTWWGGNPDMNNTVTREKTTSEMETEMMEMIISGSVFGGKGSCIVDAKSLGETTIEFPKPNKPEPYNPNRAQLDTIEFRFYQEANCVDGAEDDSEELIIEAKSSLGIDGDGGAFYVLKTKQWAINDANEMSEILKRVEAAVAATNPTSVHTK